MSGKIFLSETMTSRLLSGLIQNTSEKIKSPIERLTNRELEVFQLIGQGHKSSEIAKLLSVSVKTIDTHRFRIIDKLNLKNSSELVKYAFEWKHNQ